MAKRLNTAIDLRRYLEGLINRVEAGKTEPELAGKLGYLISILLRVIENSEFEKRIEKLEKKLSQSGPTSTNESFL